MTQHNDPTIEAVRLLREGGYHEAASDLAMKALQRSAAVPPVAAAPSASRAAPTSHEDVVRREGEMMLAAMREKGILPALPTAPDGEAA